MSHPLVSIIIPTYNRAHLIGETLDSVLAQTYTNWECIVVDDGSTDASQQLFVNYSNLDRRFRFFKRPNTKPKGVNSCRNIGLEIAKGDYVVFFDSDDLMTENHLEVKLNTIQKFACDYVITKTQYFNYTNDRINKYYQFDKFPITSFNYIKKINWLTLDVCIKASVAKSICFNENLQSEQEYNYFCKLVHESINGKFINKVVSLRRHDEKSIQSNLNHKHKKQISRFNRSWYTYLDLKRIATRNELEFLMNNCIKTCYDAKAIPFFDKTSFMKEVLKFYRLKGVYFLMLIFSLKNLNLGYRFRQKYFIN